MKKNTYYIPIFIVTTLLQFLFLVIGVSITDTNSNTSLTLGILFFLLIPINIILLILILVTKGKNIKIQKLPNEALNKQPKKDILKSYIIEFPFYGVRGDGDEEEEVYFEGNKTYKWFDDSIIEAINSSWNESNMTDFIFEKELKSKIQDMQLFICTDGTCKIIISIFEELTALEKEYLLDFVRGQASDGWGEGNFDFEDSNGKSFRISFWKKDNDWYIKYIDEDMSTLLFKKFKQITEKDC